MLYARGTVSSFPAGSRPTCCSIPASARAVNAPREKPKLRRKHTQPTQPFSDSDNAQKDLVSGLPVLCGWRLKRVRARSGADTVRATHVHQKLVPALDVLSRGRPSSVLYPLLLKWTKTSVQTRGTKRGHHREWRRGEHERGSGTPESPSTGRSASRSPLGSTAAAPAAGLRRARRA